MIHLTLHKTFSTPHGGGGPGSGAVGCKEFLRCFLPGPVVTKDEAGYHLTAPEHSIGRVKDFYGNFSVVVKALTYILTLGREGIPEAARNAVLNANYMMKRLSEKYAMAYAGPCMHEFVMTLQDLKDATGCSAMDIAKGLLDHGIQQYNPLPGKSQWAFSPFGKFFPGGGKAPENQRLSGALCARGSTWASGSAARDTSPAAGAATATRATSSGARTPGASAWTGTGPSRNTYVSRRATSRTHGQ